MRTSCDDGFIEVVYLFSSLWSGARSDFFNFCNGVLLVPGVDAFGGITTKKVLSGCEVLSAERMRSAEC